jgi:hypothetical protein
VLLALEDQLLDLFPFVGEKLGSAAGLALVHIPSILTGKEAERGNLGSILERITLLL